MSVEKPTQNIDVKNIGMKSKLNRSVQCSIVESDSENDSFTTQNLKITSLKNDVKVKSITNTSLLWMNLQLIVASLHNFLHIIIF